MFGRLRAIAGTASFAGAVLLTVGCGSSSRPSTAGTPAGGAKTVATAAPAVPTRSAFIVAADALCKSSDAEELPTFKAIQKVYKEPASVEQEAAKLIPLFEKKAKEERSFAKQFGAVHQPPSDRAVLEKIVAGHQASVAGDERVVRLLQHNPESAAYSALTKEIREEYAPILTLETGYGFHVCGEHAEPSKPKSPKPSSSTGEHIMPLGKSAIVGNIRITPTSFVKLSSAGEVVKWRVTITVKNLGSQPVQVFCGGEATMKDDVGRVYEGEAVTGEGNSQDCGDKLQPGLTGSSYLVDFKASAGAKPATLQLWGDTEFSEQAKNWSVR